uniref:Uncharacterized protein n=1 Tax=Glossina austeni TaxID=7395 RepID=A0A1A9VHZ7_GLOAU
MNKMSAYVNTNGLRYIFLPSRLGKLTLLSLHQLRHQPVKYRNRANHKLFRNFNAENDGPDQDVNLNVYHFLGQRQCFPLIFQYLASQSYHLMVINLFLGLLAPNVTRRTY